MSGDRPEQTLARVSVVRELHAALKQLRELMAIMGSF